MPRFLYNIYESPQPDRPIPLDYDDTTQGSSDSVRGILERFAREGVVSVPEQREGRFAAEFADDIPLDDPTVDTLLDQDDLSNMDEMEVQDYIRENSEFTDLENLQSESGDQDPAASGSVEVPGNSPPQPSDT